MRNRRTKLLGLVPLLASLALAGCGRPMPSTVDAPGTSGSNKVFQAQRPTLPAGVSAVRIAITPGATSVAVGDQTHFQVAITGSDGKTYTDTRLVTWSVGDAQAATIDDQGTFIPSLQRVTVVRATLGNQYGETTVTITPAVYTWQQVQSPTNADLYGVRMITTNEAWAVGARGTVLHFLNGVWQQMNYPIPATTTWRGITFANPGAGWAVGNSGEKVTDAGAAVAMVFQNGMWYPTNTGLTGALTCVSSVSDTNAVAAGTDSSGNVLVARWNGNAWVRDTSYQGKGQINAIQMIGSEGWAVGKAGGNALVLHYDGRAWSKVSLPPCFTAFTSSEFYGLHMISAQQGYMVGYKKDLVGITKGLMMMYDARTTNTFNLSNFTDMDAASGGTKFLDQVPLHGISMIDSNKGWVLGSVITPNRLADPNLWLGGTVNQVYGNLLGFNGVNYDVDNNFQHYNLSTEFMGIHVLPEGEGCIVGRGGYLMQRAYDWRNIRTGNPTTNSSVNTYTPPSSTM